MTGRPQLLLPLVRLAPESAPPPARRLDLDPGPLRPWVDPVRGATEACLLVDADARLVALSGAAGAVLGAAGDVTGALLTDVVRALDFTAAARPELDQHRALPVLTALQTHAPARGLLRLRHRDGTLLTVDVTAAPVAMGRGALAFLHLV